jgi:hypothetical protein
MGGQARKRFLLIVVVTLGVVAVLFQIVVALYGPWVITMYPQPQLTRGAALWVNAPVPRSATSPVVHSTLTKLRTARVHPILHDIQDDDPVYTVIADYQITYADVSKALVRWTAGRYGLKLGPFILGYPDGPEGEVEVLEMSNP